MLRRVAQWRQAPDPTHLSKPIPKVTTLVWATGVPTEQVRTMLLLPVLLLVLLLVLFLVLLLVLLVVLLQLLVLTGLPQSDGEGERDEVGETVEFVVCGRDDGRLAVHTEELALLFFLGDERAVQVLGDAFEGEDLYEQGVEQGVYATSSIIRL